MQALERDTEFEFSEKDFQWLRHTASSHSGIVLTDAKRNMIYSRLAKRLRHLKLNSFAEYRKILDSCDETEFGEFINAITTNLTSFFREPHHFQHLVECAIPEAEARVKLKRPIRIWSAGCSTGEEPYTIAMVLGEYFGHVRQSQVELIATDLDTKVLSVASTGIYERERAAEMQKKCLKRWFLRGSGNLEGKIRIKDELRMWISFQQLNLVENWQMPGPFDVIFCRNVAIYFDRITQRNLNSRFAQLLVPGGFLYIGHSENLHPLSDQFRLAGRTIYQKLGSMA